MTILKKAFFLLVTLLLLVGMGGSFAAGSSLSAERIRSLYPSTVQDGDCYLFRVDNCKVIAVGDKYHYIRYLFVLGGEYTENKTAAETLVKELSLEHDCAVEDFKDGAPSVAIRVLRSSYRDGSEPSGPIDLLDRCYSLGDVNYVGWSGRLLRLKRRVKNKELEILIDLSGGINCPAFRVAKGDFSRNDMVKQIGSILGFDTDTKPTTGLRRMFANTATLACDLNERNCVVYKRKMYYGGNIADVKQAVKINLEKLPDFKYPAKVDQSANSDDHPTPTDTSTPADKNKPITIGDIKKIFPTLERLGNALEGFTQDNSRVYVVKNTDSTATSTQVAFIIVQSSQNRIDASKTASQIAQKISAQCIVKPFVDPEPAAVILMPWVDLPMNSQYSDLLLAPYNESPRTTQFIALKGGLLITHIKSNVPGSIGTIRATTALGSSSFSDGVELEILDGEVNIHQFLKSRGARFHSDTAYTETEKKRNCAELRCVDEILRGKGNKGTTYLVIYCGSNTYRIGTFNTLKQIQSQGFAVNDHFTNKTAGDSSSATTGSTRPQQIPMTDEAAPAHRSGITRESPHKSNKLTPKQALKKYLEIIKTL